MSDVPMIGDPVLAVAVRAARRAASVVVDAARDLKRLPTFSKEHLEIANSAGDEARNAIVATIGAAFPEHEILARDGEKVEADDPSPYKWIVEPIDGGANFAHGYPRYAVTIALTHGTEVTHATVLDPLHDELFTAVRGCSSTARRSASRHARGSRKRSSARCSRRAAAEDSSYLPLMNAVMKRCAGLRRAGSTSLDLAYLAAGRLDGFFVTSLRAGDITAGALIVKEAGGRVGDFAGGVEFLRTSEVIASAPASSPRYARRSRRLELGQSLEPENRGDPATTVSTAAMATNSAAISVCVRSNTYSALSAS
jgi:myo-inositol-1(or 4)-monophosphatase